MFRFEYPYESAAFFFESEKHAPPEADDPRAEANPALRAMTFEGEGSTD